jgi:hypothetical protein
MGLVSGGISSIGVILVSSSHIEGNCYTLVIGTRIESRFKREKCNE